MASLILYVKYPIPYFYTRMPLELSLSYINFQISYTPVPLSSMLNCPYSNACEIIALVTLVFPFLTSKLLEISLGEGTEFYISWVDWVLIILWTAIFSHLQLFCSILKGEKARGACRGGNQDTRGKSATSDNCPRAHPSDSSVWLVLEVVNVWYINPWNQCSMLTYA